MATKKRRGLGGTSVEHSNHARHERAMVDHNIVAFARALKRGNCSAAHNHLDNASFKYGAMKAHEKEMTRQDDDFDFYEARLDSIRAFDRAQKEFRAKCLLKKPKKME